VEFSDDEWRRRLSPEQYQVLREAGTERPYSSPLDEEKRRGVFGCAGCALDLYSSDTKFDSGTGWPSFWQPLPDAVREQTDAGFGMVRTEVLCRRCGGHLGHVFPDGPKPTGLRYCMNGVAMVFRAA
jgi:peptide-methionine (R)-S-oxide reductase